MKRNVFPVKAPENEVVHWTGQFTTNAASAADGLSTNLSSVTRTAAGKYTVVLKDAQKCPQILWPKASLVGAAGYDCYITSVDKDAAATGTITCDTKANTTDDDYFTLHDGWEYWTVVLDVNGTGDTTGLGDIVVDISGATTAADVSALLVTDINAAAIKMTAVDGTGTVALTADTVGNQGNQAQQGTQTLHNAWAVTNMTGGIDGVYGLKVEIWDKDTDNDSAATGTVTFDTKANSVSGDYFILNDGHMTYGFELDTTAATPLHHITPVAATGSVTFDTKANSTSGDYFILNDGQRTYGFELDTTAATPIHYITPTAATGTITCGTKAQAANDGDYYILNDGQERYCFELDADAGGATLVRGGDTAYGNCNSITAVNVSGDTTAADVAATLKTAIDSTPIQMTVTDNADGTLTLTQENSGPQGNTQQVEAVANAAYLITDMTGGNDADVVADVWTVCDVSGATTAADVGTLVLAVINGTDIQITAADAGTPNGTLTLTQDNAGPSGNTQQQLSETGSTLLAITDMTGGFAADVVADVWTVCDVSGATTAADVGTLVLAVINGTAIQITAADAATPSGTLTLTNDNTGTFGNVQQVLSETGSTLLALTDMTGGTYGPAAAADTTDYDVYLKLEMRNSKQDFR